MLAAVHRAVGHSLGLHRLQGSAGAGLCGLSLHKLNHNMMQKEEISPFPLASQQRPPGKTVSYPHLSYPRAFSCKIPAGEWGRLYCKKFWKGKLCRAGGGSSILTYIDKICPEELACCSTRNASWSWVLAGGAGGSAKALAMVNTQGERHSRSPWHILAPGLESPPYDRQVRGKRHQVKYRKIHSNTRTNIYGEGGQPLEQVVGSLSMEMFKWKWKSPQASADYFEPGGEWIR